MDKCEHCEHIDNGLLFNGEELEHIMEIDTFDIDKIEEVRALVRELIGGLEDREADGNRIYLYKIHTMLGRIQAEMAAKQVYDSYSMSAEW